MMKWLWVLMIIMYAVGLLPYQLSAQRLNEVTASAGFGSHFRLSSDDWQGPFNSKGTMYNRSNVRDAGAYFLTYQRKVFFTLIVGMTLGVEQERGDLEDPQRITSGTYSRKAVTLALEARYLYFFRDGLRIYGDGGMGLTVEKQLWEYSGTGPITGNLQAKGVGIAWQVVPIGVRVGRQLGAFAEAGYGYKGIINIGASLRF